MLRILLLSCRENNNLFPSLLFPSISLQTLTVTSGSFTNTVCDSNLPSTCEIVLDDSQVTLSGSSTCLVCDGDSSLGTTPSPLLSSPSPAPFLEPTPTPTVFYYGSTNPAATFLPLYSGGTLNPSYVTTTMMTMTHTASPTQALTPMPAPVEDPVAACGAYIYTCKVLKRAVEYERVNRTNDSLLWLFAGVSAAAVDSLFVIESGGKLTLTDLGFQG